jgi:hypothetical protein
MLPVTTLSTWAVVAGGQALRGLVLSGLAWLLALPLLVSLEAGLIAMMLFEPMRGFLRRAQYLFLTYSDSDPFHIITPIVTLLAFAMLLQRCRLEIFRQTPLAGLVSILGLIYFLEIFNPLQGGLTVGFSGALFGNTFTLYSVAPVGWLLIGWISAEYLRKVVVVTTVQSQAPYAAGVGTEREQFAI